MSKTEIVKKKQIPEYDILRVIVTLLVIISHCGYIKIESDYGGFNYSEYAENFSLVYRLFRKVVSLLYSFHMPLFMALSGALYYKSSQKDKYNNFKSLAAVKFKRLIIPFLTVSLLYSTPLKFASGYFSESENIFNDIFIGQILVQGNTHLWYILSLFFIFLFIFLIEKLPKIDWKIKYGILFLVYIAGNKVPIQLFGYIMMYSFWFYTGFLFEPIREKYNKKVNIISTVIPLALFLGLYYTNSHFFKDNFVLKNTSEVLIAFFGMTTTYNVCLLLTNTNITENKAFKLLAKDSFGMYLYSDSWNYVILSFAVPYFKSELFTNNAYSLILIVSRILITGIISILVTELLRKLKLKYLI